MRTAALALIAVAFDALAQGGVAVEKVAFKVAGGFEPQAAVSGELRLPAEPAGRLPAVLILHGSNGVDGRGAFYAEALNAAGIATLEIDMFQGRGRPSTTRHNMPHAYQSLQYLAAHPRIDGARVGVMGFSWGGIMSLLTSSDEVTREYGGGRRFAGHLGLYPVCWTQRGVLAGKAQHFKPSVYAKVTGKPVMILAGDKDDYDDPDACPRFVEELPAASRAHFTVTVYPGATHIWDGRAGGAFYDSAARNGQGGAVQVNADPALAQRSRATAVEFFRASLAR